MADHYLHSQSGAGKKTVIVVGAGFAGLNVAKSLANHEQIHVVLVDQKNHHLFQPLLYQVATAGLSPSDIAVPIRGEFRNVPNVEVYLSKVESINLSERYITANSVQLGYDFLVLACGARHSYFGNSEWQKFAPGLKTLEQATEIRRRIFLAFERAENEIDPAAQRALLNFVVIGGGPTGVELAGAIAEISRTVLIHDFKRINPADACVILLEGGPRLLQAFSEKLSERAKRDLELLGVRVCIGTIADEVTEEGVRTASSFIPAHSVFWAAGVQARTIPLEPEVEKDNNGLVIVTGNFSLPSFPEVFVTGDMAAMEYEPGKFLPGVAPVAIQAGRYVGRTIVRRIEGRKERVFRYQDKGMLATIGKNKAIAQIHSLHFSGRLAWCMWLFVHILFLVGFRNRVAVMAQWAWSYIFSKRGARLILEEDWKL